MPHREPFDQLLEALATSKGYAIGDFLTDFSRVTGRSEHQYLAIGAIIYHQRYNPLSLGTGNPAKSRGGMLESIVAQPRQEYLTRHMEIVFSVIVCLSLIGIFLNGNPSA